jgi:hypothetical protein
MTPYRSARPPNRDELQAILDRGRSAWMPRDGETWDDFVRRKAPPLPPLWQLGDRGKYKAALSEALREGEHRAARGALLFPLWVANNEDEEPRSDEWRRHLVLWSDGEALLDVELDDGPTFWARARITVTSGAFVALGRAYAPDVPVHRFGPYAVTRGLVRAFLEVVEACDLAPVVRAPTRAVPAFSALVEPAIDTLHLPREVAVAVADAADKLQLVNTDETDAGVE